MASFDLRYEPWIPCLRRDRDETALLSIHDTLVQAHMLREIRDESPLTTVAVTRFLLAILHKIFGPADTDAWGKLWAGGTGSFHATRIEAQLREWDGLDLFSETRPFYQSATLVPKEKETAVLLDHAMWTYNHAHFTHVYANNAPLLAPAEAARLLIAFQAFDMGGMTKGSGAEKFAAAGPLQSAAVVTAQAETLFQTLMLNLRQYAPEHNIPFGDARDKLAWEREDETRAEERYPAGYLDWLTWQSRRVRLFRSENEADDTRVKSVFYVKGNQPPTRFWLSKSDAMIAFVKKSEAELKKAEEGTDALRGIGFRTEDKEWRNERALWRDSMALLQFNTSERTRPQIFDWLADLVTDGVLEESYPLRLSVYGLSGRQARVLYWRHEQLPLPLTYLRDATLIAQVRKALTLAERVGSALQATSGAYLEEILTNLKDKQRQTALASKQRYWAALETPFIHYLEAQAREHLTALEAGETPDDEGSVSVAMRVWAGEVKRAATVALRAMLGSSDSSAKVIRARVIAEGVFWRQLGRAMVRAGIEREDANDDR